MALPDGWEKRAWDWYEHDRHTISRVKVGGIYRYILWRKGSGFEMATVIQGFDKFSDAITYWEKEECQKTAPHPSSATAKPS